MIPATRAIGPAASSAKALPWREGLKPLYDMGATFRHGQVVLVAGQPGSMKSALVTWMVDLWDLPTLYLSCDMSMHTTITRLGALRSGVDHDTVAQALANKTEQGKKISELIDQSKIMYLFDDSPSLDDIEAEVAAWVEMYDAYPPILVIDNLVDLDLASDDDYRAWREALLWFKGLARDYGITVIVVHHMRELEKTDYPSARKDLQGKVSQTPEIVLSVSLTPSNEFRVAVVKNRTGRQNASAQQGAQYRVVPSRLQFIPDGIYNKPEARRSYG